MGAPQAASNSIVTATFFPVDAWDCLRCGAYFVRVKPASQQGDKSCGQKTSGGS